MANTYLLSDPSKRYLCCYYQILDEMIQGITTAKLTRSLSHNFIVQMIPHRRAAIQMSQNILRFHPSQPVQRFAQRVIDQQTREIAQMEAALPAGSQLANPTADLRLCQRRMDLIYREMYAKMGSAPENNARAAVFLQQMIPHHQGAVRMAENALKYDVCTELVPLLRTIAVRQRQDIAQMRSLLRASRCQG